MLFALSLLGFVPHFRSTETIFTTKILNGLKMLETLTFNHDPVVRQIEVKKHLSIEDQPVKGLLGHKLDMVLLEQRSDILLQLSFVTAGAAIPGQMVRSDLFILPVDGADDTYLLERSIEYNFRIIVLAIMNLGRFLLEILRIHIPA